MILIQVFLFYSMINGTNINTFKVLNMVKYNGYSIDYQYYRCIIKNLDLERHGMLQYQGILMNYI